MMIMRRRRRRKKTKKKKNKPKSTQNEATRKEIQKKRWVGGGAFRERQREVNDLLLYDSYNRRL